jgi:hypothetical protein
MNDKTIAELAEEVSLLLQLDRTRHQVSSKLDLAVLANIPAHLASVFEQANIVSGDLTPVQAYALINKRVSEVQAQVYLMRLELENRGPHDPASIYTDPMVISAYGDRIETLTAQPKRFSFGPEILANGWYPMEMTEEVCHRWMRPGDVSIACVPHLGTGAQTMEIEGYVMHEDQFEGLSITAAGREAVIEIIENSGVTRFTALLTLEPQDVKSANYLPVEFRMDNCKPPNNVDTRMLGANIQHFTCRSAAPVSDAVES